MNPKTGLSLLECLGSQLYHSNDDVEFMNLLRENPRSHTGKSNGKCCLEWADYTQGLTTIVDDVLDKGIYMVGKMESLEEEILWDEGVLEELLNFKTTHINFTFRADYVG